MARAAPPLERVVQRQIVSGLRQLGLAVIAVPNGGQYAGGAQARIRMAMAKRMDGEVAGFPDLIVLTRKGAPRCGFLEVKREGVSLATDTAQRQLDCHARMTEDGHHVALVRSLDEALTAVREWGLL